MKSMRIHGFHTNRYMIFQSVQIPIRLVLSMRTFIRQELPSYCLTYSRSMISIRWKTLLVVHVLHLNNYTFFNHNLSACTLFLTHYIIQYQMSHSDKLMIADNMRYWKCQRLSFLIISLEINLRSRNGPLRVRVVFSQG